MSDSHHAAHARVAGIVLAGGLGSRMGGGGKHLRLLGGQTLLTRALERLAPQVDTLLLSCNDPALPPLPALAAVLADPVPGFAGPLAGVLAGLEYLCAHPERGEWLLSVAVDTPRFPRDLAARLQRAAGAGAADIAVAGSPGGTHPVFALWPARIAAALREHLEGGGDRSVRAFQARYRTLVVRWESDEPFHNLNTPADLARAARAPGGMPDG